MQTMLRQLGIVMFCVLPAAPLAAQSLRGSPASVSRMYRTAQANDFTFLRSGRQILDFVEKGYLVKLEGNGDYSLANVSYPYARPQTKVFIERLAAQYRAACGEPLVVTSLTRPRNDQPDNASRRSVHPTGMALDVRRTNRLSCRKWIERTLLSLEKARVIEATRERWPPHYHIAVFPKSYTRYVAALSDSPPPSAPGDDTRYRVRRGDSLWSIARNYGIGVEELKAVNDLPGNRIYAGQDLRIPTSR